MKPAPFRYARPATLAEAVDLLVAFGGEAKLLAGGQSLIPRLNLRLARPSVLVDLALVPELQVLELGEDVLVVGAGVRQRTAETSERIRNGAPLLPLALRHIGHVQTRARGTIGGSLAHADPAAELPGAAVALDAELVATGPHGRRSIGARNFFVAPHATALHEDEVLTEVRVPVRRGARYAFLEAARQAGDPAPAAVAHALELDDRTIRDARFVATGVADVPLRLTSVEEAVRGAEVERIGDALLADAVATDVAAADGVRADPAYACRVVAALASRALAEAAP